MHLTGDDDAFDFTEEDEQIITGVHPEQVIATGSVTSRERRPAPRAQLMCVTGSDVGRVYVVGDGGAVFGRAPDAEIRVDGSDVSRRHAQIGWRAGGFHLDDLDSANGTFVNDEPVLRSVALHLGDRIQLGSRTIFVLSAHDELASRAAQLAKLEAMEQAVAGVAAEFHDALLVIAGALDDVERGRDPDDPRTRQALRIARETALGASALAARLLALRGARGTDGSAATTATTATAATAATVVDLGPLMRTVLAGAALPSAIVGTLEIDPRARVLGSEDDLRELLSALIANARDAMPGGGQVSLAARIKALSHADAVALHLPRAGTYVDLVVADTGRGMDAATQARAFEPLFTTKAGGRGAGLGLAIVRSIARRHGGVVGADATTGAGTAIRVLLPLA